jgi:putative zinc finger/helix-turn-helix YgiT family protein
MHKKADRKTETNKCELCSGIMVTRKATSDQPYRYEMSGLDNVLLIGIEMRECNKCHAQVPLIPKIAALHKAIAEDLLLKKELLSGKEIRFLRKNAGIAAKEFAALISINPSHLSRVENGKTENLSPGIDKLARAVAAVASDGDKLRKVVLALAAEHLNPQLSLFSLKKDHWEKLAA